MTATGTTPARAWFWAAVALTLLKLWLTRGLEVYALGGATHDDDPPGRRLFTNFGPAAESPPSRSSSLVCKALACREFD